MSTDYDVAIVGGGLAGASLACALSGHGLRLAMIEPFPFLSGDAPGYDDRTIALAEGSRRIFSGMGLWARIESAATPIREIHVSEQGRFGVARINAREQGVAALGYVTPARAIGEALNARLAELPDLTMLSPAKFETLEVDADRVRLTVSEQRDTRTVSAALVVASDGSRSRVRESLGIGVREWRYGQSAIIANLTTAQPHHNVAYERFTASGPLALLPIDGSRCALVCTVDEHRAPQLVAMPESEFLEFLQQRFGNRLGRFLRIGKRQLHRLTYLRSSEHYRPRVAVIGNAAQTLHPVAGQGFNLGLRDVAVLAEVVCNTHRLRGDVGGDEVLRRYADWRSGDQGRTAGFTDLLVRVFGNPLLPLRLARNAGLLAFDQVPPLKRLLVRNAMGLAGRLPRLARGIPL